RPLVVPFAELMVAYPSLRVDEVEGWPVLVLEGAPDGVIAVDRDRIADPHVPDRAADVVDVLLERELGSMDADDGQPPVLVLLGPGSDIGKRAQPVDAGVGPDVDDDDVAAQTRRRQRLRIEPSGRARERGQVAFDRQFRRSGAHLLSLRAADAGPGA